jgi:uncharacterized protein YcnI/copper(I)-binding protein
MNALSAITALLAVGALAAPACAHATLESQRAVIGASYKGVVRITHGCEGTATTKVRVVMPEGIIAVKPMPKPGWTLAVVKGPYAHAYKFMHGGELSAGTKEVTWSGGQLPDDNYDEFTFSGFVADSLTPGTMTYFPVYQDCEKGAYAWVDTPAPGQDPHALKAPAPGVMLIQAADKPMAMAMGKTFKAGAITVETPWARATPGGAKVAGAYMKITNTGTTSDRLVGGTVPIAGAVEVHEMAMTNNVMKMRMLENGLEIKPGQTVELKPGGYHLMLTGLKSGLTAGQSVKGTLKFEKAGTVEIEYTVAPIGAQSGGGHMHH